MNKEDWKTINAWLDAVLAALPAQPLKTTAQLGGAPLNTSPYAADETQGKAA